MTSATARRWLLVGMVLGLGACTPVRVSGPVCALVADEATGRPIAGAAVLVSRSYYSWAGYGHPNIQTDEGQWEFTREDGKVCVAGGLDLLFPFWVKWETDVFAVGPGYEGDVDTAQDRIIGLGVPRLDVPELRFNLRPFTSQSDVDARAASYADDGTGLPLPPRLQEAEATLDWRPMEPPGVHSRVAGGTLDRVACPYVGLVVHDATAERLLRFWGRGSWRVVEPSTATDGISPETVRALLEDPLRDCRHEWPAPGRDDAVVACTRIVPKGVVVALASGGLWHARPPGKAVAPFIVGPHARELQTQRYVWLASTSDRVYAVRGTSEVFAFSLDGVPMQRVAVAGR